MKPETQGGGTKFDGFNVNTKLNQKQKLESNTAATAAAVEQVYRCWAETRCSHRPRSSRWVVIAKIACSIPFGWRCTGRDDHRHAPVLSPSKHSTQHSSSISSSSIGTLRVVLRKCHQRSHRFKVQSRGAALRPRLAEQPQPWACQLLRSVLCGCSQVLVVVCFSVFRALSHAWQRASYESCGSI